MKTAYISVYVLILIIFSCTGANKSVNESSNEASDMEVQIVHVDQILENPDTFVDKKVKVEGLVTHVCKHSGKRLHLTSISTNKMIRVEAADGINQFERELEGNDIIVEGILHKQVIDEDYLAKWENEGMPGVGVHMEHSSGDEEAKAEQIQSMRHQLKESGENQLVSLWIDGNSFEVN